MPNHEVEQARVGQYNKLRKLTDADKLTIQKQYRTGQYSQRELARMWSVSRRLVIFCIYPERLIHDKEQYAKRQADGRYYDREQHTKQMREHRAYKKQLLADGKIHAEAPANKQ